MNRTTIAKLVGFMLAGAIANVSFAGGRYADPPPGMVETHQLCTAALEAAKKGDTADALEKAKEARKISIAAYKEKSTMPMEIGSTYSKKAIASFQENKVDEAIASLEHCSKKLGEEIDYYKKEGKL
jgi:hypothetical protein